MPLTVIEKCAGRWFRDQANQELARDREAMADRANCSAHVKFFRHECTRQAGRTRSIKLDTVELVSPEIWVTWSGTGLEVISQEKAHGLVDAGEVVEFEVVLAGKFSFMYARGRCGKCHLAVISEEGDLRDARELTAVRQDDLATFSQGMFVKVTGAMRREHE